MRGRTINNSFIILDEAQSTTTTQMKMFFTRMGFNSKVVITGDITQIDLPDGKEASLKAAHNVLKSVEVFNKYFCLLMGVGICWVFV